MPDRVEFTADLAWDEFLAITEADACAVGFGNRYVVTIQEGDVLVVEKDTCNNFRAVRGFSHTPEGDVVTQTSVSEKEMGGEDVEFIEAFMERRECADGVGIVAEAAGTSCRHRYVMRRTFPDLGLNLSLFAGMDLPGVGGKALPDGYFGEVDFSVEGGVLGVTFMYAKFVTGEGGRKGESYALSSCGEIQEKPALLEVIQGEVDFDTLRYRWRAEQLPGDPTKWLGEGEWRGSRSTLEIEGNTMWSSEGEAEWRPPDTEDNSMALVLTAGEAYFWGPRTIEPLGSRAPRPTQLVFQAGKRVSKTRFQRVEWRYNGEGHCTRIDHEVYNRKG
ncbi:unnamed protein product [Ostreobium quekettii]|uniref:Uncharacterized protein n=1 Tax=Ostreobium quekettii TaxID=121088 RepID=A0A8S1IR18_9CHLO|nr:unnamed protein product [Ostreobium quekettii]|eukprot:evm.model.scf_96.5 EVM.evm.TU.scf_96.5   scf_96:80638-84152(+)